MTELPSDSFPFRTLLARRQQVSLRRLVAPAPDAETLSRILEAASHAPDHGQLRPWRFILIPEARRADLGAVFAGSLAGRDPAATSDARAAAHAKAFHAPVLLVAVLRDDPATSISRSEKLVSLGCAIQNVLLATTACGFASGLASGVSIGTAGMRTLLQLAPSEEAICFIGIGTPASVKPVRARPAVDDYFSSI